jgi:thymidine kinase
MDFQKNPFGATPSIAKIADKIFKLKSKCYICGQPAPYTIRLTKCTDQIQIGGTEMYQPACEEHF